MSKMLKMRPPRIAFGLLFVTLGIWHLSPQGTVLHFPYKLIATICVISGFAIMMWGWVLFKKAKTGVCATSEASVLVRTGIFRKTRNPMYLGMLLMLTGAAFFMGTLPALLAPLVFFLIIDKAFIPYEEDKLRKGFGTEYAHYMETTRKWI